MKKLRQILNHLDLKLMKELGLLSIKTFLGKVALKIIRKKHF